MAYGILSFMGAVVDIGTVVGIVVQGASAGVGGLMATALILLLLNNQEFREARLAIHRRVSPNSPNIATIEPTDIAA